MSAAPLYPLAARGLVGLGLRLGFRRAARRGSDRHPTAAYCVAWGAGRAGEKVSGYRVGGMGAAGAEAQSLGECTFGALYLLVWELCTFYTAFYVS